MPVKKILILLFPSVLLLFFFGACGQKKADGRAAYEAIMASPHMTAEDAQELLKDAEPLEEEIRNTASLLQKMTVCSGRFVQTSEESQKRYYADVSFYFAAGQPFCRISYDGFVGELADGEVELAEESGYLLASSPMGDLFGQELPFSFLFGEEQMFVSWGKNNSYTLRREASSAADAGTSGNDFEGTTLYQTLLETVDNRFSGAGHSILYDGKNKTLNVYVQAPDSSRKHLDAGTDQILSTWNALAASMNEFSGQLLAPLKGSDYAQTVNLFLVDTLNARNAYTEADYLLWVQNGSILYNYAQHRANGNAASPSVETADAPVMEAPANTPALQTSPVTTGERNALQSAQDYLKTMAFSYDGLIEQLEYEGYTASEARYAVDNCGADWDLQAVKMAREYMDASSFSRSELIEQLEYEGFSHAQAEYAVSVVY